MVAALLLAELSELLERLVHLPRSRQRLDGVSALPPGAQGADLLTLRHGVESSSKGSILIETYAFIY